MALPKPCSTITCIAGPVMSVPRGIGKSAAEDYRQTLERTMLAATEAAEAWARSRGCRQMASDAELWNDVSIEAHGAIGYEEAARLVLFKKDLG